MGEIHKHLNQVVCYTKRKVLLPRNAPQTKGGGGEVA